MSTLKNNNPLNCNRRDFIKYAEQGAKVTLVDKGYVGRSGLTPWFHGFAYYDYRTP